MFLILTWGFTPGCPIAGPSAIGDRLGAEPNEVVVLDAVGTISTSSLIKDV
jgi:hypothetical protein